MLKLTVKLVVDCEPTWQNNLRSDVVAASIKLDYFDDKSFNAMIIKVIEDSQKKLNLFEIDELKKFAPEVSVNLHVEENGFRPAFHLEPETIALMQRAGASLDFDPYIYPEG